MEARWPAGVRWSVPLAVLQMPLAVEPVALGRTRAVGSLAWGVWIGAGTRGAIHVDRVITQRAICACIPKAKGVPPARPRSRTVHPLHPSGPPIDPHHQGSQAAVRADIDRLGRPAMTTIQQGACS